MIFKRLQRLPGDEKAQATTEFVVIFPIVFFTLVATIQLILVTNIVQVGHYAAFCAARSLAVHVAADSSEDKEDAEKTAKTAAAIAYAPVSQPVSGETLLGITEDLTTTLTSYVTSWLKDELGLDNDVLEFLTSTLGLTSGTLYQDINMPDLEDDIPDALEPLIWIYIAAHRMGDEGFKWEKTSIPGTSVSEVFVTLTYGYPLSLVGFSGLWNFLWGKSTEEAFQNTILGHPLMPISTKCAVGYEPWSGTVLTEDGTDAEGADSDNPYTGLDDDFSSLSNTSSNLAVAKAELEELQKKLDECIEEADGDAEDIQACHNTYDDDIEDVKDRIEDLNDDFNSTLDDLEDQADTAQDDAENSLENACD